MSKESNTSDYSLTRLNLDLSLPSQEPGEVVYNSDIGRASQLIPFKLQSIEFPPGPFTEYSQELREEFLNF
jgi:hypothetical protein